MTITVEQYQLAYKAVPKAACSSVKAALTTIDDAVDVPMEELQENNKRIHAIYQTSRFNPRKWRKLRSYYRFTVVRDPIKRILSVYTNRVVSKGDLQRSRRLKPVQDQFPANPDPDFFFQNLAEYMGFSSSIKHHALHTFHFTGSDLSRFSKVYRTSDLGQLGTDLGEIVGQEVVIPRFNSTDMPLEFDDLKPKTRKAIIKYLDPEFQHLGALFPRPM